MKTSVRSVDKQNNKSSHNAFVAPGLRIFYLDTVKFMCVLLWPPSPLPSLFIFILRPHVVRRDTVNQEAGVGSHLGRHSQVE